MDYLYKLRSAVSTVKSTVESALPGNPIGREYEATTAVASAGPCLCWTIYDGYKKSTKQEVSVWWLEKRHTEKWPPRDRDMFLDMVKRGVQQLTRLRHPKLLIVEHALEESKDSLAFCTEPIFASLANVLRAHSKAEGNSNASNSDFTQTEIKNYKFDDVEIKMGFRELAEALKFLHSDARIIHRNLRPESILITKRSAWKLAGFEFFLASVSSPDQSPSYPPVDYDSQCPSFARPSLDYCGPELPLDGRVDVASDIYSFGLVFYSVFSSGKKLHEYHDDVAAFRRGADSMRTLPAGKLNGIPEVIREDLKLCLQFTPELRPDAGQLLLIKYCDDAAIKLLASLESLRLMDGMEKANFFKNLMTSLTVLPQRILTWRVLPALADEMKTHSQTVPLVVPAILQASANLEPPEFGKFALPALEPVFQMDRAYQAWHLLLQKMDLLLNKMNSEDTRRLLVPMACNALEAESPALQETCAQCLHRLATFIDPETMKKRIVPKLIALAIDMNVLSVRINALLCLGRLLGGLEKWQVTDQILTSLAKIQSRDPAVLMAVLGVFKLAFSNSKFGIGRDIIAKICLPFLVTSCAENALNLRQFEAFMSLIREMLTKLEAEQRRRLESMPGAAANDAMVDGGCHLSSSSSQPSLSAPLVAADSDTSNAPKKAGALSLDEKRRLAAEQEKTLQLRSTTPLEPKLTTPSGVMTIGDGKMKKGSDSLDFLMTQQLKPSPAADPFSSLMSTATTTKTATNPIFMNNSTNMLQQSQQPSTTWRAPNTNNPMGQINWPTQNAAGSATPIRPGWSSMQQVGVIPPPPPGPTSITRSPINLTNTPVQKAQLPFDTTPQKPAASKPRAQDELADLLG